MAGEGYDLKWKNHSQEVFSFVRKLRPKTSFSDVVVHCGGKNFFAHKVILAASSSFFERVLSNVPEEKCKVLVMTETRPEMLTLLLDFIYDGEAYVRSEDLENFMSTAEKLEIRGLRQGAEQAEDSGASFWTMDI
jgi:hypothetical protein